MISVKSNLKQLSKQLAGFGDQIPYATSRALNATAFKARIETINQLKKDIDRPTPFTIRGVRYSRSNKRNLTASVYFTDDRWEYIRLQIDGGKRRSKHVAISIGVNAKRNSYGNVPRNTLRKWLSRPDTFSGSVRGIDGIWQRTHRGHHVKLLFAYHKQAEYKKGRFKYKSAVNKAVKEHFNNEFTKSIKQAIKSARL